MTLPCFLPTNFSINVPKAFHYMKDLVLRLLVTCSFHGTALGIKTNKYTIKPNLIIILMNLSIPNIWHAVSQGWVVIEIDKLTA